MLLWLCFALLTAAIVALLLRPLRKADVQSVEPAAADLAVYRDQLRELESEQDRGLFNSTEIENARAEIARRLLKRARSDATGADKLEDGAVSVSRARTAYGAIAALLPLVAIGLYLVEGSPHLPDQPFQDRRAVAQDNQSQQIAELIARVEERLREHPEEGKGWDAIAPVYLRLQRYGDAAHAFAEANRLEGESVRRLLGFAEATLMAEGGIVTEPVRKAALRVLELEPQRIEVRAWVALAKEQDGDLPGAAAEYRDLIAKAPADARWRSTIEDRLKIVEKRIKGEPIDEPPQQPQAPPQASPEAPMAAAPDVAAMSPDEREAFIAGMVDRLATRLKENGKDLEGWIKLARAYKVLGRDGDAKGAIQSARENFAGDQASLAALEKSAESLGIAAQEPQTPQ
jgi:cytochrome c-type biogenesis protein CcmH